LRDINHSIVDLSAFIFEFPHVHMDADLFTSDRNPLNLWKDKIFEII